MKSRNFIVLTAAMLCWVVESVADNIKFADPEVKKICVANWDTNGDGELSKDEAVAVKDLGRAFVSNFKIKRFEEFQYFTGVSIIGNVTFQWCTELESIILPSSISKIEKYSFNSCYALKSIEIPKAVVEIGNNPFTGCRNLASVKVSKDNPKYDSRNNCNAIIETSTNKIVTGCKSTVLPENIKILGTESFSGCISMTSFDIPNSVTTLEGSALNRTSLSSIFIPASVTKIGSRILGSCEKLKTINVSAQNSKYDSRDNCNAIIETSTNKLVQGCNKTIIPNTVNTIGYEAFLGCSFESIIIPNSVTSLDFCSFSNCDKLETINIPNSVLLIGEQAFQGCLSLKSVIIPSSVTSIGDNAFYYCTSLCEVTSYLTNPFEISENVFGEIPSSSTLFVPKGAKSKYKSTKGWKNFANIVEVELDPNDIDPITTEISVDTGNLGSADLTDNVVGNVYYNLNVSTGSGYDNSDHCIVIGKTTDMSQIGDKKPGSADVKEKFTGIILMVDKGKSIITINTQTLGSSKLAIQVGNNTPNYAVRAEKGVITVECNVKEATYMYVYIVNDSGSRAAYGNKANIYSFNVKSGATGIQGILTESRPSDVYDLRGRKVRSGATSLEGLPKGIYIVNGKKNVK